MELLAVVHRDAALLAVGILVVLVCILECSTLKESRYEAVDITLDEFDFYTTHSYYLLYDALADVLNNTTLHLAYAKHVYLGTKDCVSFDIC